MRPLSRTVTALAAVGVASVAVVAGAASASIPDGGGSITACYVKSATDAGAMAPIMLKDNAKGSCPAGYTALSWSQHGIPGPKGDQGAKGDPGPKGDQGPGGPAVTTTQRTGTTVTIASNDLAGAFADCAAGEHATAGGYVAETHGSLQLSRFAAVGQDGPNGNGWAVYAQNVGADKLDLTVTVICAK